MSVAVRYYSRSGKTKKVAEVIAKALGTKAVSVDSAEAKLDKHVDMLFVGGALYAYGLDKHLDQWLDGLDGSNVERAALFSTSWISRHALGLMRKKLEAKGISVAADELYLKSSAVDSATQQIEEFALAHQK